MFEPCFNLHKLTLSHDTAGSTAVQSRPTSGAEGSPAQGQMMTSDP